VPPDDAGAHGALGAQPTLAQALIGGSGIVTRNLLGAALC